MRGLARLVAIALIGIGLCSAGFSLQAALPPINPPPPPVDPQGPGDPVDPPDDPVDPCNPPHHQPEPGTLGMLLVGGGLVGLRALRRSRSPSAAG